MRPPGARRPEHSGPRTQRPERGERPVPPPKQRGPLARLGLKVLLAVAPLVLLTSLALLIGYVKLLHGSISLKFLVGPIERGIAAELGGMKVQVDDAILGFGGTGGLEFRLKSIRLSEADGDLVASAPLAAAELSLRGLRDLRLVPERVELIEPKLFLFYSRESGVALAFQRPLDAGASASAQPADVSGAPPPPPSSRLELGRALTEATARARRREDASSYLREVALKDATVVFDHAGQRSTWHVSEFALDLEHKKARSLISGRAIVASSRGPWSLTFVTDETQSKQTVAIKASLRDLVPSALAHSVPGLGAVRALDMPISGDATIDLSPAGDLLRGEIALKVDPGHIDVSGWSKAKVVVDGGLLNLAYDGPSRVLELRPSAMRFGEGKLTLAGRMEPQQPAGPGAGWRFAVRATEGFFAADEFGVPRIAADHFAFEGHWLPLDELVRVERLLVKAGGGEIAMSGILDTGEQSAGAQIEGRMSPMPLATLKAIWPRAVAPAARRWVGEHVSRATVTGGTLKFASGRFMARDAASETLKERISLSVEAADAVMHPLEKMAPVEVPRTLIRLEDRTLEVTAAEGAIALDKTRKVPLKAGRLFTADVEPDAPAGEITFRVASPLAPVLEVLEQPPFGLLHDAGLPTEGLDGKIEAQMKLSLPLAHGVQPKDIKVEGKAKLSDGRAKALIGNHDAQGATVAFDFTESAVTAQGEMLLAGVLAKINWQRILDGPDEKQPPLRITAALDNSDRNQLGLELNHIVQGEVPVELTVHRGAAREEPLVRLRADLTAAELNLEGVAWRKPAGRAAHLQLDIVKGKNQRTELQNLKIAGDDIAVEGWAAMGPDGKLREFHFPELTLNVVSRMEVRGEAGGDGVWSLRAKGPTFDGRDFFRSLFSIGQGADRQAKQPRARGGLDLDVEFDTVLGHFDTSLRGLKVKMSSRAEKLTALDARGMLEGGKPLVVALRAGPGEPRRLLADSTDAGAAFKLVGFYPNVQDGRVRLEVNVDGKGPAEKTGTLWVEDFQILGDPVVSEVFSGAEAGQPGAGGQPKTRVTRQVFEFDRMRVPFSVGYGQFVMEDSYLRGPVLGASIRGKVDYKTRTVSLGGTYVPLQGLNNALGTIPVLGQILSGPRGEGIFGITFAIQGPMANPQVIVNPLSLLTPGFTRELMQMTSSDPRIQARDQKPAAPENRPRAPGAAPASKTQPRSDVIDGWSSETTAPKKK